MRHATPESRIPSYILDGGKAGDIEVMDLHENNVVLGSMGRMMHPIDAHFYFDDRAARMAALEALGLRR